MRAVISKIRRTKKENEHDRIMSDPDFPVLVSFPRTGSHWLRMMLENYADRPILGRSFFEHSNQNYLLYHTHDDHLTMNRSSVIYLYRDPVQTIFSLINYYKQDWHDKTFTVFWSHQYATHLCRWLNNENFTSKKTVIRHDKLKNNFETEFKLVTDHLGLEWNEPRALKVKTEFDKQKVKREADNYNKLVMGQSDSYLSNGNEFANKYTSVINLIFNDVSLKLLGKSETLLKYFDDAVDIQNS